jgi:hypothetical protein
MNGKRLKNRKVSGETVVRGKQVYVTQSLPRHGVHSLKE